MSSHIEACGSPGMWPIQPRGFESPKGQALANPISIAPSLVTQMSQPVSSVTPLVMRAVPATSSACDQKGGSDNELMVRTSRLGHAITIASSPATVPLVEVKTPATLRQPVTHTDNRIPSGSPTVVASSTTAISETKARELTTLIGSVADLAAALPDNIPSVLSEIIHEYRLNLSVDSLEYINKLIGKASTSRSDPGSELIENSSAKKNWCSVLIQLIETNIDSIKKLIEVDPTQGYALLARLIATKCIDLVAFGITSKDATGLAPHMKTHEGVTFDTHLEERWEAVEKSPEGYTKKQQYDHVLINIFIFADCENLNLLGKACDNTQGFISVYHSAAIQEGLKKLSRVEISLSDFARIYRHYGLHEFLGRSSRILPSVDVMNKRLLGELIENICYRARSDFFQNMTVNSFWDFCPELLTHLLSQIKVLRVWSQNDRSIFERVLVNSYREFQKKTDFREVETSQESMDIIRRIYNEVSDEQAFKSFDELLIETPIRSQEPIQYKRAVERSPPKRNPPHNRRLVNYNGF